MRNCHSVGKPCVSNSVLLLRRPRPTSYLGSRQARSISRPAIVCQQTFSDVKAAAYESFARARDLLPALEEAQRIAADAREPAAEAERRWQEAHGRLTDVQGRAQAAIQELRSSAEVALGGTDRVVNNMLRHHVQWRMESFRDSLSDENVVKSSWRPGGPPAVCSLAWLPGATMTTRVASVRVRTSDETEDPLHYLVACVAIAMPPLNDSLRSILLHWSLADGPSAGWANFIPQGWHTSPGISHPYGSTAWQTGFAPYAPVIGGNLAPSATVFSVVVQIPMEGFLERSGGLKFVLKRSDGSPPEWIKPGNNADFWLDFGLAIDDIARERAGKGRSAAASAPDTSNRKSLDKSLDADSIDEWGWVRVLGSRDGSSDEDDNSDEVELTTMESISRERAIEDNGPASYRVGWLAAVPRWEVQSDYPPPQPQSLGRQVEQLGAILTAELDHLGNTDESSSEDTEQRKELLKKLLSRCLELDDTLQSYDAASLQTRHEQQEKESLWEMYKLASDDAARLQAELVAAVEAARQGAVALRGRSAEVTPGDLEALAAQMAQGTNLGSTGKGFWPFKAFAPGAEGKQLAFVTQRIMTIGGLENAHVVVQVYLEGEKDAVTAAMSGQPLQRSSNADNASEDGNATDDESNKKRSPAFHSVVVSVAAGEAIPDGGLRSTLLHVGMVPNQNGKWRAPPAGWQAIPTQGQIIEQSSPQNLPWIPLQTFTIVTPDGRPVFVDPELYGACLRLPLGDLVTGGLRGIEFVLKTPDDRWLQQGGGSNFYIDLPVP